MFTQDALLLVGHGSTVSADAARPLLAHAEAIRGQNRFSQVAVGMLLGEPRLEAAFDALAARIVQVVPFFLEDGYFTRIALPDRLLPRTGSRVVRYCSPVGMNEGIGGLLEGRLIRHCETFGTDPKTLSVVVAGHGSGRNPGRARALRQHVAHLENTRRFGWVRAAYLEEEPTVTEVLGNERGHVVAVLGYLANEGMHATVDLPRLIADERERRGTHWPPVHDLGSIGGDPAMPRLIVEQVTRHP